MITNENVISDIHEKKLVPMPLSKGASYFVSLSNSLNDFTLSCG